MSILDTVKRWFGNPHPETVKEPVVEGRIWDMRRHQGWGNAINYDLRRTTTTLRLRIWGHIRNPRVADGDLVAVPMTAMKSLLTQLEAVALFRVENVEYEKDPADMFSSDAAFVRFATGEDIEQMESGYVDARQGDLPHFIT